MESVDGSEKHFKTKAEATLVQTGVSLSYTGLDGEFG